jgi:hypothetical protein
VGPRHSAGWWLKPVQVHSNEFKFNPVQNFVQSKLDLPGLENFDIKFGCEVFDERDNFPYRNFSRFEIEFELKFREASLS